MDETATGTVQAQSAEQYRTVVDAPSSAHALAQNELAENVDRLFHTVDNLEHALELILVAPGPESPDNSILRAPRPEASNATVNLREQADRVEAIIGRVQNIRARIDL